MSEGVISAEMLAKIRIARSANVGPVSYRQMMLRHGSAQNAIKHWDEVAKKNQPLCGEDMVRRELDKLFAAGGWMVVWGEEGYPAQLADLPDPPIVLSGLGDKNVLHTRSVAIVGNRNASANGIAWCRTLAEDFAKANVTVVSGLARGIDTAAHEGSLSAGGMTVAVVAGGVDHIYPPENAKLRERIMQHGCVVSEQAFGMVPTASLFPRRNRIIAGLSVGVVVSEATRHSGSLITAECALNYGREVWAVPGSPGDLRSGGPNWLLKNGAALIENAADVLVQMPGKPAPFVKRAVAQPSLFNDDEPDAMDEIVREEEDAVKSGEQKIFALLGRVAVTFDELVRQSGLNEAETSGVLTELELMGHAVREADGRWRRA